MLIPHSTQQHVTFKHTLITPRTIGERNIAFNPVIYVITLTKNATCSNAKTNNI